MKFKTINPATEEVIGEYRTLDEEDVLKAAQLSHEAFLKWRKTDLKQRQDRLKSLSVVLHQKQNHYAELITREMGKPIHEAMSEIKKCAFTAELYADLGNKWLDEEFVQVNGKKHIVTFEPLGVILSIMPWNFPFWQALRFGIPALLAGNTCLLKHSNLVPQCAVAIEEAFTQAGFPKNVFKTIIADHPSVAKLMASDRIAGISFTGSTQAGSRIGELAGKHLKKVVLELGGSDPFIVLDDADPEFAAENAVTGRTTNTGQSCISAKRFIVTRGIAEAFTSIFVKKMGELIVGDPLNPATQVGPLVNQDGLKQLEGQVQDALDKGGRVLTGGKRKPGPGFFFEPTVIIDTKAEMKIVSEEVFGPVAPIIIVRDEKEAIQVANGTEFGLGASVWLKDLDRGMAIARQMEAGTVFINSVTKSDPRMPFGGIKKSGVGRELSRYGLLEFVNIKGISVYDHKN